MGNIILIAIVVAGIYGWIMNIIELIGFESLLFSGKVLVGVVGIFVPPIGAIMGLFVW